MKDPIIKLRNIHFSYEGRKILEDLNLEIREGERLGLVGPNGSGKTTLLYIIMGLLKPERGSVEIFGKIRQKERDFLEVRQKIGLLFQDSDSQLFCPTVKEDIAFGPLNLGLPKGEVEKMVRRILKILGLEGFEDRVTYKLSGGEKKLVSLGTVLAMNPVCYLLDEPSAGLDEVTVERVLSYLKTYAKTYLIVSHDRKFLEEATEKIYILRNGKISTL